MKKSSERNLPLPLKLSFCFAIMCTGLWTLILSFFGASGLPHQPILCISMLQNRRRTCSMLPQQLEWIYFYLDSVDISSRGAVINLQALTVVFYLCLHVHKPSTTVLSQLCKCMQTSWVLIAKSSEYRHTNSGFHQHTWTALPFPLENFLPENHQFWFNSCQNKNSQRHFRLTFNFFPHV